MVLLFLSLVLLFLFICNEYGWKGGLCFTLLVGFIQDPARKIAAVDSSYYSGVVIVFFLATFYILKNSRREWDLKYICWTNPRLLSGITLVGYYLVFQLLNSYSRFGDLRLVIVGTFFYLIPLCAVWVGYQVGKDQKYLRLFLTFYVLGAALWGLSVLMSVQGVESDLFKEVGLGLDITRFGRGNSGLWRTSEIAGWHLAAGACLAFILGMSSKKTVTQALWFVLSVGMTLLSTTTGRRKAIGIIIAFVSLYLLYYVLTSKQNNIFRAFTTFSLIGLLLFGAFGIFSPEKTNLEDRADFSRYSERASSLTLDAITERLQVQGLGAFLRGVEISGPFGFGLGAGANAGDTGIGNERQRIRSLSYVTEGGGGRIVAENGYVGVALGLYIFANVIELSYKNFKLGKTMMESDTFLVFFGLILFLSVNLATFFAAGQLYSDVFVLMILGVSFGAFTALPVVIAKERDAQTMGN